MPVDIEPIAELAGKEGPSSRMGPGRRLLLVLILIGIVVLVATVIVLFVFDTKPNSSLEVGKLTIIAFLQAHRGSWDTFLPTFVID